jgi:glycerate-2-kinase
MIFSDVPGDDLHTIASAPTLLDESTLEDARRVFDKYGASTSFSVEHLFETPKDPSKFSRVRNELVVTNKTALEAMRDRAQELGYTAEICDTELQGEARDVAKMIVDRLHSAKERRVYLYGGETTVTISGPGKGGRNEELSAAALPLLQDDELVLSFASDGRDNTDFAGGIADVHTREQAKVRGLQAEDFLFMNDTFSFFHTLQQGVETGYTGANVADLVIAIKHESS